MRNIGDAFSFIFRDPDWPVKLLLGALFTFLSIFLIGIPVLYGYYIELLQRVRRNDPRPLPDWKDPGIKFITGLKYLVVLLLYYLPFGLLLIPALLIVAVTIPTCSPVNGLACFAFLPFLILFLLIYTALVLLLTPFITIQFSTNERISDGLAAGPVFKLLVKYWVESLLLLILTLAVSFGAVFGILFFIIGVFATSFYSHLVIFHLYAQMAQTIDSAASTSPLTS